MPIAHYPDREKEVRIMVHQIKCGHCSTRERPVYHRSVADVRAHTLRPVVQNTRTVAPPSTPMPEWRIKTPRAMVENMRDGRYAVSPTGSDEYDHHVFIRVSRPTHGKKKGCLVVQTQHSDAYSPLLIIYPSGRAYFSQTSQSVDMALMLVAADPYTAAMKYSQIKKVCCRCGKQLTDERSRWYGIGPECKDHWPEIINTVNQTKGSFGGW